MTNCEWFNSKLEAYFCDGLSDDELQGCQDHLATCTECRRQVESLKSLDTDIRQVFDRRLRLAQKAAQIDVRPRVLKMALAGTGMVAAATLLVLGLTFFQPSDAGAPQQPPIVVQIPPDVPKDKPTEPLQIQRTKPD